MSETCSHQCGSCSADCAQRTAPEDLREKPNAMSKIKKVIAVVSGKGGVGKSMVTSLLACKMQQEGYHAGILDADITGPSIPQAFGVHQQAQGTQYGILPVLSKTGIDIMSINLLLEHDTDPVVWRGPIIAGTVKQFWTDVIWNDVDYLFVDMPPGTGDVPLTVFQSLPVDGIIIVSSPQELVGMIVEKAVNMAQMMKVPVLALVENMSYFTCPDCGSRHAIFGDSHAEEIVAKHQIPLLARLPIDPSVAAAADQGKIEEVKRPELDQIARMLEQMLACSPKEEKPAKQQKEPETLTMAVSYDQQDGTIFQHFGKTPAFLLYTLENGHVKEKQLLDCGESGHSALVGLLAEQKVAAVICGGIGGGAKDALAQAGITVFGGVTGSADQAVEDFLRGRLAFDPDVHCDHHDHAHGEGHSCGEHGCGEHH